jgi:hypothetical protein
MLLMSLDGRILGRRPICRRLVHNGSVRTACKKRGQFEQKSAGIYSRTLPESRQRLQCRKLLSHCRPSHGCCQGFFFGCRPSFSGLKSGVLAFTNFSLAACLLPRNDRSLSCRCHRRVVNDLLPVDGPVGGQQRDYCWRRGSLFWAALVR